MSHTALHKVLSATLMFATAAALPGCDTGESTPPTDERSPAGGKADDNNAAPIGTLAAGGQATGSVSGDAIHVYVVQARPGSIVVADVERTDGDLDPTAFAYQGLRAAQEDDFLRPRDGFENTDRSIRAAWEVPSQGDLLLIVAAGGGSAGAFDLALECHEASPVPCTENGVDDEVAACEYVRDVWNDCMEAEDESDEACDPWLGIEDTTQEEDCCDLWRAEGLPGEDFCP